MNKTVIGIVLAVVVVAAGGWYFYSSNNGDASNRMMAANTPESTRSSLKDLMARGTSKCTVSNSVANSESTGTVYIGDGKMRGDFETVMTGQEMTIESHMINDGEFIYTWSNAMPQGVKLPVDKANMSGQPNAPQNDQIDMYNADVSYECDSWSVDEKQFELPKSVTFVDISTMMPGAGAGAGAGAGTQGSMNPPSKSQQCQMCDSAPEPQRTQCRQALQCR